jgi:hypothetical protein
MEMVRVLQEIRSLGGGGDPRKDLKNKNFGKFKTMFEAALGY